MQANTKAFHPAIQRIVSTCTGARVSSFTSHIFFRTISIIPAGRITSDNSIHADPFPAHEPTDSHA